MLCFNVIEMNLGSNNLSLVSESIMGSTVYPGMTENLCLPILSKLSKLKFIKDFNIGYSPERINPGDKKRKLENIPKLVSASNLLTLKKVYNLYSKIIKAKIHKVETIKTCEFMMLGEYFLKYSQLIGSSFSGIMPFK